MWHLALRRITEIGKRALWQKVDSVRHGGRRCGGGRSRTSSLGISEWRPTWQGQGGVCRPTGGEPRRPWWGQGSPEDKENCGAELTLSGYWWLRDLGEFLWQVEWVWKNFNSCLEKIQNWEVIRHLLLVLYLCFLQKSLQNVCSITNFLSVSACHSDSVKCWLSFCYRPHMVRLAEMCLLALCGSGRSGSLVFIQQRWLACVSSCSCSLPIREWEGLYSTPAPWQVRFLPQYRPVHPFGPCTSEGEAPGSRTYLSLCQCGTRHIGQACLTAREPGNVREQKTSGWAWPSRPCTPTFKTSRWESLEAKCLIQSHNPQTYPALSSLSLCVYTHTYFSLSGMLCVYVCMCVCVYMYVCDVCILCIVYIYMHLRVLVSANICPVNKGINTH